MKTKLLVKPGILAKRYVKNRFFYTILGLNPYWDYNHYIEYISPKIVHLNTTNKIHLKADCLQGSVANGLGHPIVFSFFLDKPSFYMVFCEPETIQ